MAAYPKIEGIKGTAEATSVAEGAGGALAAEGDAAAAIDHGVTVLAWARVDGVSPGIAPYDPAFLGGVSVATADGGVADDVVVDGRIITAENSAAAPHELGHALGIHHVPADDDTAPDDIVTGPGPGGGPHVKVFSGGGASDDGDTEGQDVLIWQRGGSPGAAGGGDLADWQDNYGSSSGDDLLIGGLTGFGQPGEQAMPSEQMSLNFSEAVWPRDGSADGGPVFLNDDLGLI
jgi:hypothetical protein